MSIAVNVNDTTANSSVSSTSTTGSNSLTGSNSASDLQGSFLTLLVAQLKNQDPTNPMQNNELTTQLAQISTVSGIEKLNTTLGSVSGQINSPVSAGGKPDWSRGDDPGAHDSGRQRHHRGPRRLALSCRRRLTR